MECNVSSHSWKHFVSKTRQSLLVFVAALSLMLSGWQPASAAVSIYYVDNTNTGCSDTAVGAGTLVQPFCTISKGAVAARAGDTVRVLAGTYAEKVTVSFSGVAGSPITYSAASGVTVTGIADPNIVSPGFTMSAEHYVVIDGFNVTGTTDYGIRVSGSDNITISNNHVSYAGSPVSGSTKSGIYINSTTDSTVHGNTADHNSYHGILLTNGCSNVTVSDNLVYANAEQWQRDANGIRLDGSSNNTIVHNIAYANEDSGLNFYTNSQNNQVLGNLTYGNGDHGIDFNASPNNTVVGNTAHGNVTVGIQFEAGSGGATVANNIMVDNGLRRLVGGGTSSGQPGNLRFDATSTAGSSTDYNLFFLSSANGGTVQIQWGGTTYPSLAAFQAAEPTQEVHGIEADPLFVSPAPVAQQSPVAPFGVAVNMGNYHLTSGSPAIDSANAAAPGETTTDIEGNARMDDTATPNSGAGMRTYDDRGAYEFQQYPTTTSVDCGTGTPVVSYGSTITCVATVTASIGTESPSGSISWSTSGAGSFSACTLSGNGGSASCSTTYTPTSVGTGSHLITANYAGVPNFPASSGSQTVTVNKLAASVTPNAATKVYGQPDPNLTGVLTGFLLADHVMASYTRIPGEDVTALPYVISAQLSPVGVLANYNITYNTGAFTITPKPITVTANPGQTKVVGHPDPAVFTYTSSDLNAAFIGSLTRETGEAIGNYAINQGTLMVLGSNYSMTFVSATFSITANTAPVAVDQSVITAEGTAKAITLTATDVNNDALTYVIVAGPAHGTLTGTAPALTYTPDANYIGPDSFTFKANDGTADSNVATVTITVTVPPTYTTLLPFVWR